MYSITVVVRHDIIQGVNKAIGVKRVANGVPGASDTPAARGSETQTGRADSRARCLGRRDYSVENMRARIACPTRTRVNGLLLL